MLGAVVTNEESWLPVRATIADLGHCAGPDDIFFALRGMRTLERAARAASARTRWRSRAGCRPGPEVSRVLYPALPEDPGHALWKRDFLGASGLFGVVLKPVPKEAVARLCRLARPVRHRRQLGRLREPDPADLSRAHPHRDALAAEGPWSASISASKTRRT